MVITPMLQKGVTVKLAQANNPVQMPDADKEDALIVAVMNDGAIYFDTAKITPAELAQKVRGRNANRTTKHLSVNAATRAAYNAWWGGGDGLWSTAVFLRR